MMYDNDDSGGQCLLLLILTMKEFGLLVSGLVHDPLIWKCLYHTIMGVYVDVTMQSSVTFSPVCAVTFPMGDTIVGGWYFREPEVRIANTVRSSMVLAMD